MSVSSKEPERSSHDRRHVWLAVGGLAVLAVWALASVASWDSAKPVRASWLEHVPAESAAPPLETAAPRSPAAPAVELAADGLPIMRREASAPLPPGPVHPHPITEAHLRIYRENNLLGALNGALDVNDAAGLRRLLEQYRAEYPEDSHELQAGYEVIADCLDRPGAASTARARHYYDTETSSTLRRYVRRHCFENGS